jgi:hypothetical protein
MRSNFVTVKINCTPVVKNFLENNFGIPVTIPEDHVLYKLACAQLVKKNTRANNHAQYAEAIELGINHWNFIKDGFDITEQNTRLFNTAVDNYIKLFCRSNIDSMLISQTKQEKWKEKVYELLETIKGSGSRENRITINKLKAEIEQHEINIKKAIEVVVCNYLKMDMGILNYEAVKKDYYRYRQKNFSAKCPSIIN